MQKIFFLITVLIPGVLLAQPGAVKEITKTDITKQTTIDGSKISVFGMYLGMSRAETKNLIKHTSLLKAEVDGFNTESEEDTSTGKLRYYIYNNYTNNADKKEFLYVIFDKGAKGISSIVLFTDMKELAVGGTKDFFTNKISDLKSTFCKKYLGTPSKTKKSTYGVTTNMYKSKKISTIIVEKTEGGKDYYFKICMDDN
jgi:hypothetical protein